jgi:hypothetical protein
MRHAFYILGFAFQASFIAAIVIAAYQAIRLVLFLKLQPLAAPAIMLFIGLGLACLFPLQIIVEHKIEELKSQPPNNGEQTMTPNGV